MLIMNKYAEKMKEGWTKYLCKFSAQPKTQQLVLVESSCARNGKLGLKKLKLQFGQSSGAVRHCI